MFPCWALWKLHCAQTCVPTCSCRTLLHLVHVSVSQKNVKEDEYDHWNCRWKVTWQHGNNSWWMHGRERLSAPVGIKMVNIELHAQLTFLLKGLFRLLSLCKHCYIIRSSKHMTNIQSIYVRIGEVWCYLLQASAFNSLHVLYKWCNILVFCLDENCIYRISPYLRTGTSWAFPRQYL